MDLCSDPSRCVWTFWCSPITSSSSTFFHIEIPKWHIETSGHWESFLDKFPEAELVPKWFQEPGSIPSGKAQQPYRLYHVVEKGASLFKYHGGINCSRYLIDKSEEVKVKGWWRKTGGFPLSYPVVIRAVDVPGHSKVSDLDHQALPHQAVSGGQVAVDEVQRGQVDHARGDLSGDVQHLRQRELPQRRHLGLLQDPSVRAVSSAQFKP